MMSAAPLDILRQYWHYPAFRPYQEEIIRSVLDGRDTLALLPTGGGKSVCYQVPALSLPGLCLVVSPLIALMKDQVDDLRRKDITAFALYAGMSRKEVINTLKVAAESNCKLLYVSPERLETRLFAEYLPTLSVSLIAVDEAHCVSQWGYDFRPPYLRIAAIREILPDVPVLALTASATPDVLEDISEKLALREPALFRGSFTRPNLSFSVFKVDAYLPKLTEILGKVPGSSIVYCRSRKATEDLSRQLNGQGFRSEPYHAGLSREERTQRQEDWLKDRIQVMVCTNAFGMGIDKAAVRTVIHAGPPESPESYYQEAGRAGRDGKKAYAVLLYTGKDLARLEGMPDIRFPAIEAIRTIFQALMNTLQLPVGSGEGNYYDFDYESFVGKASLTLGQDSSSSGIVPGAIKALEQEGLFSFIRQIWLPARVRFTIGKRALYDLFKDRPALEPLLDTLLREYEGIFDEAVPIREKNLAFLLRKDVKEVSRQLRESDAYHIIEYTPEKDGPQLYFFRDRPRAEELYIDPVRYRLGKDRFAQRTRAMIRYAGLTEECRGRSLSAYFGDKEAADCGICDNCLRNKKK